MRLRKRLLEGALVVAVEGDLDVQAAPVFRAQVEAWLDEAPGARLVLDLRKVGLIDSTGLGALLGRYRRLSQEGLAMAIVAPPGPALAVLSMGGLTTLVPVYRSLDEALGVRAR